MARLLADSKGPLRQQTEFDSMPAQLTAIEWAYGYFASAGKRAQGFPDQRVQQRPSADNDVGLLPRLHKACLIALRSIKPGQMIEIGS
jgi:hypothetical protein